MANTKKLIENPEGVKLQSLRPGTLFTFEAATNPNVLFVKGKYNQGYTCINTGHVEKSRFLEDWVIPVEGEWVVSN